MFSLSCNFLLLGKRLPMKLVLDTGMPFLFFTFQTGFTVHCWQENRRLILLKQFAIFVVILHISISVDNTSPGNHVLIVTENTFVSNISNILVGDIGWITLVLVPKFNGCIRHPKYLFGFGSLFSRIILDCLKKHPGIYICTLTFIKSMNWLNTYPCTRG